MAFKMCSGAKQFAGSLTILMALAGSVQSGDMQAQSAGDILIEDAFSRATLPNQPVAGAFLTLTNTGKDADRLIGGSAKIAGRVEIHEMAMSGDVMRMRALPDGLELPAGEMVELKPGGYHIMLFDLATPLKEGERVEVTLEFAKGGTVVVPVMVQNRTAKAAHSH